MYTHSQGYNPITCFQWWGKGGWQQVGRTQNSVTWETSWPCTNGVLFQPPLQKWRTLQVRRGLDAPLIIAKWKALTLGTPNRGPRWREGWAMSAMPMGAEARTSGLISATKDTTLVSSRVPQTGHGFPLPPAWGARILEVDRVHSARATANVMCPWTPSFHSGKPHCPLIPTGGSGYQHLSPLASAEVPTFPSDESHSDIWAKGDLAWALSSRGLSILQRLKYRYKYRKEISSHKELFWKSTN